MIDQKIKLVAVSYLNTKPMLAGLKQSSIMDQLEIVEANPGACAEKMIKGEADIALIPVATIPNIPESFIISNYCIGAKGKVDSVSLFSEVPLSEIDTVLLDYQSRTSTALCQILLKKYWKQPVVFKPTTPGYIDKINGKTAGLVIGDRSFGLKAKLPYSYDLSEAWLDFTNLPFVFASWISRIKLSDDFLKAFDKALATGLEQRAELAQTLQPNFPQQNVLDYFTQKIDYHFDVTKRLGLNRFYQEMGLSFEPSYHLLGERVAR